MALVLGTNIGFVTTAPTSDPEGSNSTVDTQAKGFRDTSPSTAIKITEIGWYCDNATEEANFEVAIYDHNVGNNEPDNVVGSISRTNAKGTSAGWKVVTGLSIPISASTIYWIAVQVDNTATTTNTDRGGSGRFMSKSSQTTLLDPFVSGSAGAVSIVASYAKVEAVASSATDNMNIIGENVY